MRSVRRWSDSDEPHASATDHLGTRASGPYVESARRLGLRLVPGYASLRPACGSGAPSGASATARCHRGTRASGPHAEAARRLELRLPPAATGVRGPPARMWKQHAIWGFGCRPLPLGYASLRPACGSSAPSRASAAACCHRGTRASGPYVKAARRLGLRLVPGYVGLRPACAVYGGDFLHPLVAAGARE